MIIVIIKFNEDSVMGEVLKAGTWEGIAGAEQEQITYTAEQVDRILAQTQEAIDVILKGCDTRDFLPSGEVADNCLDARNRIVEIRSFVGVVSA